ncbi:uncharacterized protein LOC123988177 isoform X2 [Osmia bicornis bicornis]|uniref:uncharacterized protein LOC123988177 isoform X2 n=1 Tax=Osmia bicornis bicornis TaxID=1437191 RepID=UPI001EAF04AE|nr:uncharacterized protein LOC123988177 isoform X2 [Osmia bicornis bicornis]
MVLLIEHHQPPSFRYFSHWPHGAEVKRGIGSLAGSHPGETLNDIPPSLNFLFSSSSVMLEMSRSLHDGFSFFNDATELHGPLRTTLVSGYGTVIDIHPEHTPVP